MPLKPGKSQAVISTNIKELENHGSRPRSHKQIIAIAEAEARRTGGGGKHSSAGGHRKKRGDPPSHHELAAREDKVSRHEKSLELDRRESYVKESKQRQHAEPDADDFVPTSPMRDGHKIPGEKKVSGKNWEWQ